MRAFGSIGRFTYRRRLVVALAWLVMLMVGLVIGPRVFSHLGGGGGLRDDAESVVAYQQLARVSDSGSEVSAIIDGRAVLLRVGLRGDLPEASYQDAVQAIRARLGAIDAPRVLLDGEDTRQEFRDQAERDLKRGEMVALVWVFQEGHLAGVLGFEPAGMVEITVPLLVFVFAFGLSVDYEVFLLSRIKEAWDQTGNNDHAVALGLQRTGRIVTSAAALMVVVFLGFAAGELLTIKEIGVGMAIAIVLDATVVRTLLVPATMTLTGRWNWWAPARLRRLHDRIGLNERGPAAPSPEATPEPAVR